MYEARTSVQIIAELARENRDIWLVVSDFTEACKSQGAWFERCVDVGIAEQNLIGLAAGLAVRGKIPFVFAMAPFVCYRSYEQMRVDLAYGRRNVKVVGCYSGFSVGSWGPTHHALEDIGVLRTTPEITIIVPADSRETENAIRASVSHPGPVYIREVPPDVDCTVYDVDHDFVIGKAVQMREGRDVTLIGTGNMVRTCIDAAGVLDDEGISAEVLNIHTLQPFDGEAIANSSVKTGRLISVEEHQRTGGLGSAVGEVVAELGRGKLVRLGVGDIFEHTVAEASELREKHGLTIEGVVKAARDILS